MIGRRAPSVPARSASSTSAVARVALCTVSCWAWTRNALSERDENCETTIAVETAATSANAAPSHKRMPMKRRFMLTGYACRTTVGDMQEGDAVLLAASSLQVLAGQRVEVETPHPRAATKGLADRLDGRLLASVEAVVKH